MRGEGCAHLMAQADESCLTPHLQPSALIPELSCFHLAKLSYVLWCFCVVLFSLYWILMIISLLQIRIFLVIEGLGSTASFVGAVLVTFVSKACGARPVAARAP